MASHRDALRLPEVMSKVLTSRATKLATLAVMYNQRPDPFCSPAAIWLIHVCTSKIPEDTRTDVARKWNNKSEREGGGFHSPAVPLIFDPWPRPVFERHTTFPLLIALFVVGMPSLSFHHPHGSWCTKDCRHVVRPLPLMTYVPAVLGAQTPMWMIHR